MKDIFFEKIVGFDWNKGNQDKNSTKHNVFNWECEQVFFNEPLILQNDIKHSSVEPRMYVLGRTDDNRELFIAFTVRNSLLRVISARDMSVKERKIYDKA